VDDKANGLPGWQNRLAGTGLTKNWEAFKSRNPNTVQQVVLDINFFKYLLAGSCGSE
jgi:hypothetical protein